MDGLLFSVFPNETFVDLNLYQCGWEQCKPSHSFGPAIRNNYLFHYVISGTGVLHANEKSTRHIQIGSGQGFMIFPGQVNTYIADAELPWEYVWIEFNGLRAREIVAATGMSPDHPVFRPQTRELGQNVLNEMMYIVKNSSAPSFRRIGRLFLFMDALLCATASGQMKRKDSLRDFYVSEAIAYIERNFQNEISVEDIANTCGLNRSYFGKIFKETVGKTTQEFLINYRMVKAAELLKMTQFSVGDIGKAVGYENPLHFSRAFKNVYGISPREYRNRNAVS